MNNKTCLYINRQTRADIKYLIEHKFNISALFRNMITRKTMKEMRKNDER